MTTATRLPFAPVEHAVTAGFRAAGMFEPDRCTPEYIARRLHTNRSNVYRWRRRGLTIDTADTLACHLNLHPALLWPDEWCAA